MRCTSSASRVSILQWLLWRRRVDDTTLHSSQGLSPERPDGTCSPHSSARWHVALHCDSAPGWPGAATSQRQSLLHTYSFDAGHGDGLIPAGQPDVTVPWPSSVSHWSGVLKQTVVLVACTEQSYQVGAIVDAAAAGSEERRERVVACPAERVREMHVGDASVIGTVRGSKGRQRTHQ